MRMSSFAHNPTLMRPWTARVRLSHSPASLSAQILRSRTVAVRYPYRMVIYCWGPGPLTTLYYYSVYVLYSYSVYVLCLTGLYSYSVYILYSYSSLLYCTPIPGPGEELCLPPDVVTSLPAGCAVDVGLSSNCECRIWC